MVVTAAFADEFDAAGATWAQLGGWGVRMRGVVAFWGRSSGVRAQVIGFKVSIDMPDRIESGQREQSDVLEV